MMTEEERQAVVQAINEVRTAFQDLDRGQVLEATAFLAGAWIKTMNDLGVYSIEKGKDVMAEAINTSMIKYFIEL